MANTYTGAGGTIVVIDSGWSSSWNVGRLVYQYDFANGDADARNPNADAHGALVTSSILSQAPDVGIISLKVMPDGSNSAEGATIEQALQWVAANASAYNIVGVNLSLAGGSAPAETTTILSDELASLAAQRVLVSAAAGNAGQNGTATDVSYYAADHNVICVSASTGDGALPGWSQRNAGITDLCADGTAIALTDLTGRTLTVNGSSFSTPAVTAAVALAQQEAIHLRGSALTQDEFLSLARETGTAIGTTGYTDLNTPALLAKIAQLYTAPATGTTTETAAATPVTPVSTNAAPTTAASTIVVNAKGTMAGGVNAHFTVLVDGKAIGEATVGTAVKNYSFATELTAGTDHTVQIRYDNDTYINGQDRNLTVGTVTVNGHSYAATDSAVTYDKGAFDGKDVVAGQSNLWWNGTLAVHADKSLFGTHAAALQTAELQAADSVWSHAIAGHAAVDTASGWSEIAAVHAQYAAHDGLLFDPSAVHHDLAA
ncbi:carbohydrate-binding domain-containing protein [Azospirillum doebereinerae]